MSTKTNKLNIYLIKGEHTDFDEIVKPGTKAHPIEGVGTFYWEKSHAKMPDWVNDFFVGALDEDFSLFSASARGVLLVRIGDGAQERVFALNFGHGRHLLRNNVVEERFGLKVVLNSVLKNNLRSIDKTTLGSIPKQSREQMSRESEAANFGIDIEQDLINAVTGRSEDCRLGKTIYGRDALAVSVKVEITQIRKFLPICLEKYRSDGYKDDFEWIDQIKDVRDQKTLAKLNKWLIDKLRAADLERIWMAPPTVLDWVDVRGFRYGSKKKAGLRLDLDAGQFLATLSSEEISLSLLKHKEIYAISTKTDDASERWNAFECFYAEAHVNDDMFVLNNGKWYQIATNFIQQVLSDFQDLPESDIVLPPYTHANEGEYNDALPCAVPNSCCMDRQLINYGGGHSTIEFCDLLTADKRLIHVKRYGGSAQFSHLFNQAVVSGELFVGERQFRQQVNEKLPDTHKFNDVTARPNASEYEVVFAIISKSKKPLDIPFFSKVGLRNARRRLEGYGYRVRKKKISNMAAA